MVLRLLIFLLLLYLVFLFIYSLISGGKGRRVLRKGSPRDTEEMVLDPQCQSYIPKGEALHRGDHYFCSEECARAFGSHS